MGNGLAPKAMKRSITAGMIFGAIAVVLLLAGLFSTRLVHAASSGQNCDDNAVVYCGATSVSGLIGKYNDGDGRNTATSIHNIYSWFGISSTDIQAMGSTAQSGSVTSSGDVYVGNQLVATNALTGGRQDIQPGSTERNVQGTVFFTRPPSVSFLSSPLDAYVVMKDGVFQFAILTSCGNPIEATPKVPPPAPAPTPTPSPPAPTPTPTPAPAPAPQPTPTSPAPAAATPTSVSVCSGNTTNSNNGGAASQGGNCSTNTTNTTVNTTTVQPPPATPSQIPSGQCTGLIVEVSQTNAMMVIAAVSFQALGGAQLQSITYNFGDTSNLPPTSQTTMSYTYQQSGTYLVTATLNFTDGSQSIAPSACQAPITISAPAPAAPASSTPAAATTTAATTTAAPVQSPPAQLVNTGPGDIAGIFGVFTLVGTIGHRLFLSRKLMGQL